MEIVHDEAKKPYNMLDGTSREKRTRTINTFMVYGMPRCDAKEVRKH